MIEPTAGPSRAVVLGGKTGLLGQSLVAVLRDKKWDVVAHGRDDADVLDSAALERYLGDAAPEFVFNTIAYTQVDKAEDEPEEALRLNKALPACLGRIARQQGFWLVHYSTDFVFDGRGQAPYQLSDEPNPQSVYGRTKLAGENALLEIGLPNLNIVRTAWLFGPGRKNFVKTILTLARQRPTLGVVHDQIGSPTYTPDLALYSYELARRKVYGIFHLVNAGRASWCELAAEAVTLAELNCTVNAITSAEYPQQAKRPAYSVLATDKFTNVTGITPRPWPSALREYVFQETAMWEEA